MRPLDKSVYCLSSNLIQIQIERKHQQDKISQRLEQIEREKTKQAEEEAKQEKIQTAKQIAELNATVIKLIDDNKELLAKEKFVRR